MPRRNKRADRYEPLDFTPAASPPIEPTPYTDSRTARIERAKRHQEAWERQEKAHLNSGIDWSVCLVPGCGRELKAFGNLWHRDPERRDHTQSLPLCENHLSVAYTQACRRANDALMVKAVTQVLEHKEAKAAERDAASAEAWKARTTGHIYFVRLNGLVKAGWSRDVDQRLRAYGPDVEVLTVYPGTRDDETNLHRQLRPVLARGREWYEDGQIIADFVGSLGRVQPS